MENVNEKYIVEVSCAGLFNNATGSRVKNNNFLELIEATSPEEAKNKILDEFSGFLDVIYCPVNIWTLGEKVWSLEEENEKH